MSTKCKKISSTFNGDDGFSLIEVIVALIVLGLVASGVAAVVIRASTGTHNLQTKTEAAPLARQALEKARAYNAEQDKNTGLSGIVKGRTKSAVVDSWQSAATNFGVDISTTFIGDGATKFDEATYDSTVSSLSPNVPISYTRNLNGRDYQVNILIGICTRERPETECIKSTSDGDQLYRVVALVTWAAGVGEECLADKCSFTTSTLITPIHQTTFPDARRPVAVADPPEGNVWSVPKNGAEELRVLDNDSAYFSAATPITLSAQTQNHSTLAVTGRTITATGKNSTCGIETFQYQFKDSQGFESNTAIVNYQVVPGAVDDSYSMIAASATLSVADNDAWCTSSGQEITIIDTTQAAGMQASVNGTSIDVTLLSPQSQYVFTYSITDAQGTSEKATVTITPTPEVLAGLS